MKIKSTNKNFFFLLVFLVVINLGCVRKIRVDSIEKPEGIYAGLIDVYIGGKIFPLLPLCYSKISLTAPEFNPLCIDFEFKNDSDYDYLYNLHNEYFFIVVKGNFTKNQEGLCWGTITIKQILYIVPLTKEEAFCLSQLELPDKEIEKLRDNPFKILEMCGIKKKPIKVKIN